VIVPTLVLYTEEITTAENKINLNTLLLIGDRVDIYIYTRSLHYSIITI